MELSGLDLNLLVSLQALLRERSVTRAAIRVGVGQPAMSLHLARLRRHFGDELLRRHGNAYLLTPLASQLVERTDVAVSAVDRVFGAKRDFDPATSDREFRIEMSDYSVAVLAKELAALMDVEAPQVRLYIEPLTTAFMESIEMHRTVDAFILPHGLADHLPSIDLYTDEWVCVISADNSAVGDYITMEQLADMPWVLSFDWPNTLAMQRVKDLGIEPRIRTVVESFALVPFMIRQTERVAFVQRRLADVVLASHLGVRVLPCPFHIDPIVEALWWHPMYEDDVGHRWLRSVLGRAAARVNEGGER